MSPRDESGFAAFCDAEYGKLVGLLSFYCHRREVAEELAQEALVRAWQNWSRLRRMENPRGWLIRIALNLGTSHLRRLMAEHRAMQRLHSTAASQSQAVSPGPDVEGTYLRARLFELSQRQRTALVLRYYADLPFVAIADIMGVPVATAKSLVQRATSKIRQREADDSAKEVPYAT